MEQDFIPQTTFDQMVGTDREQLLKALLPYFSPRQQQILAFYTKAQELSNTLFLFQNPYTQMHTASFSGSPLDLLNDVRRYCFGKSKETLDQMTNMIAIVEMMKLMNFADPIDNCEEERQ